MFEIIIEAVMNFCLSNSINKSGYNLSRNIRRVFFNKDLRLTIKIDRKVKSGGSYT
jgi:hypothetical protein